MKFYTDIELEEMKLIRPIRSGFGVGRWWEYKSSTGMFRVVPSKDEAVKLAIEALPL